MKLEFKLCQGSLENDASWHLARKDKTGNDEKNIL